MSTIEELLAKRAKLHGEMQSMHSESAARNEPMTGEIREKYDRMAEEMAALKQRADDLAEEQRREAELVEDQAALDEARAKSTVDIAETAKRREATNTDDVFARAIRGDRSGINNAKEIVFMLSRSETDAQLLDPQDQHEVRVLAVSSAVGSGGATVPTGFLTRLYDFRETYSTFRAMGPEILRTSTGNNIEMPVVNAHGIAQGAAGSAGLVENSIIGGTDPVFAEITLGAYKAAQVVPISNELIQDNAVNLEGWLAGDLARAVARRENEWFWAGSGTGEPLGVTNAGFTGVETAANNAITYADMVNVLVSLDQTYGNLGTHQMQMADGPPPELCWAMAQQTLGQVFLIQDRDGRYMFQPMLSQGMHDRVMGYKVVTSAHLPVIAPDATVIYFGSARDAFVLREAGATRIESSDDSKFARDARDYRIACRVDLRVRDTRAIKSLTMAS